jgi:acetoacetate decarboxylase
MSLVQSLENLQKRNKKFAKGFLLGNVNMVMVIFKTDPAVIERIIPPPLKPTPEGLGTAYIAEFQQPNFIAPYNEAALSVQVQYNNELGSYCLAMPVDHDLAMAAGRELYGFPKKIADSITLIRKGNSVHGVCIRHKVPIIEIKATMQAPFPESFTATPWFLIKAFPGLDGISVDDHPRLIRVVNKIDYGPIEIGPGELLLNKSVDDPLYEIPVHEVTTAAYIKQTDIWLQPGKAVAELNPQECYPYLFTKWDWDL